MTRLFCEVFGEFKLAEDDFEVNCTIHFKVQKIEKQVDIVVSSGFLGCKMQLLLKNPKFQVFMQLEMKLETLGAFLTFGWSNAMKIVQSIAHWVCLAGGNTHVKFYAQWVSLK